MRSTIDAGELLERAAELQALHDALDAAQVSGRLVLVSGEAGLGKTALLRRFVDECGVRASVLWGACDALFTPRPLGPLFEVAQAVGGRLEELVTGIGTPHDVAAELGGELRGRSQALLVLEDLHWADEATLDVLRLLARRLESFPGLVVATYRDEELEPTHPLRVVLGDLAGQRYLDRVQLSPLSLSAVGELAAGSEFDAGDLRRVTGGNPFFVTEVLTSGGEEIPASVRDALLARTARLSAPARSVVEALAVIPGRAELWLLEAIAPDAIGDLDEALASGMLSAGQATVAFRHELARRALEEALPPHRRERLHRSALDALAAVPEAELDLARLAHHAEASEDREGVLKYAPAAAAQASRREAHREAAALYAVSLRFAAGEPPSVRAELLERMSDECFLIDDSQGAIEALEQALDCHREVGDERREAGALTALANVLWCPGRVAEAHETAAQAVALAEQKSPGRELAAACAQMATLHKDAEDAAAARHWAQRALAVAEDANDDVTRLQARITMHGAELLSGEERARYQLEACREAAAAAGAQDQVARVWVHLVWQALRHRAYGVADGDLTVGLDHARRHSLEVHGIYLTAYRAWWQLDRGQWDEAVATAGAVLRHTRVSRLPRILAKVVTGLVLARRGQSGAGELLDDALASARPSGELQRVAPAASARAELAWLEGDAPTVDRLTREALALAVDRDAVWVIGELGALRSLAGLETEPRSDLPPPFAAQMAGESHVAAAFWDEQGCVYHACLCRLGTEDEHALRRALADLHELGAAGTAAVASRRLREQGVRGLPRGPRPSSRSNPAGLTQREVEVLALLADGLQNREIAQRLYLSHRTVDSHVRAILRKLDARTRSEAAAAAVRLGVAAEDR